MDARRPVNLSRSRSAVPYCTCIAGIPARVANVIFLNFLPAAARELHSLPTLLYGLLIPPFLYYYGPCRFCPLLSFFLSPFFRREPLCARLFTLSIFKLGDSVPLFLPTSFIARLLYLSRITSASPVFVYADSSRWGLFSPLFLFAPY